MNRIILYYITLVLYDIGPWLVCCHSVDCIAVVVVHTKLLSRTVRSLKIALTGPYHEFQKKILSQTQMVGDTIARSRYDTKFEGDGCYFLQGIIILLTKLL
jgi:hypothetical protein